VRGEIRSKASAGAALTGCRVPHWPQNASRDLTWLPQ